MELSGITELGGNAAANSATASDLGQEDFLRMLIAQLENQDPLNPQEATEFSSQLAQFSSLEQEVAMRSALDQISAVLSGGDKGTAIDLIGREVIAETPQFEFQGGQASLQFELAGFSDSTVVEIRDANGNLVQTADLGASNAGLGEFVWDGKGQSGNTLPNGTYSFEVQASSNLRTVGSTEMVAGRVSSAGVSGGSPVLRIGDLVIPLSAIREVLSEPTNSGSRP